MNILKKLICIILSTIFIITLSGCNGKTDAQTSNNSEKKVQEIKTEDKNEVQQEEPKFKTIVKGTVNKIENYCQFTINDVKFGKKIIPPKPSGVYTYYEAKEPGTTYLDTVVNIKSLLKEGELADRFLKVEVIYDNKYTYSTFSTIEENGGDNFTYTNIKSLEPLKSGNVHFIAEVPEEVSTNTKSVVIVISTNNEELRYNFR
ncbi:hypothetical protein [Clostridium massiliodielmoense]|uniref:hypothetical protein n=1 Tax=Clostridium massiliodielmoense TaxID=1776385 RepID=UPI001FA90678|nr:hypothetical protein [Clostridium massiliodielmoense]